MRKEQRQTSQFENVIHDNLHSYIRSIVMTEMEWLHIHSVYIRNDLFDVTQHTIASKRAVSHMGLE